MSQVYDDAPPPYSPTVGSSSGNTLQVPQPTRQRKSRNGISPAVRRSMEDEQRPVPKGWVRQFDQESGHQFYVDTTTNPPRSIWHHPYDDQRYLSTLSSEDRERIQHEHPTISDMGAETTDDEEDDYLPSTYSSQVSGKGKATAAAGAAGIAGSSSQGAAKPASISGSSSSGKPTLGRRLKDKITSSTHEEREADRRKRALEEQRAYEMHQKVRVAMAKAAQTGQRQLVGRDSNGKEVYVEPPQRGMYGGGGMYPGGAGGYNPYAAGPYGNPNAMYYSRPAVPYGRPYGYGYGGGLGMPLAGGLAGGLLLGGLLGGF